MDRIHRLREALSRVLAIGTEDSHHADQDLFEELMVQKPRLLKLFDVGPRNPKEQKEIESGNIEINGKSRKVNSDFVRQVLFTAQHLDCSENYLGLLLTSIMRHSPNLSNQDSVEGIVSEFHERRRHLADAVQFLLVASIRGERHDASPTLQRLSTFVRGELLSWEDKETTWALRIFKEIQQLDAAIAKAEVALKNAVSNTVPPTAQGQGVLGHDIIKSRLESMHYERRQFAIALTTIARHGALASKEIPAMVDWLKANSNHPMTYYILTAVFAALEPKGPATLATDATMKVYMKNKVELDEGWKDAGLKAALVLRWVMFTADARFNSNDDNINDDAINTHSEQMVWNAVQGGAFTYLGLAVARMGKITPLPASLHAVASAQTQPTTPNVAGPLIEAPRQEVPLEDTKLLLLGVFETLVRSLITYASSELRKIKQRQEDIVLANARTDQRNRNASSRFGAPPAASQSQTQVADSSNKKAPRFDIAIFYAFIGVLYSSLPPERALQFWGAGGPSSSATSGQAYMEFLESSSGRLPAFLQWAVWSTTSQDTMMLTSLFDMLRGLANGEQCSELCYNFMARGTGEVLPGASMGSDGSKSKQSTISWIHVFGTLDSWGAAISRNNNSNLVQQSQQTQRPLGLSAFSSLAQMHATQQQAQQKQAQEQQFTVGPKEVMFAKSALMLLGVVVTHSVPVRTTIASQTQFRAIPTLVGLIPLAIPLELKGALFDTLSAFCETGAGHAGVDICKAVWVLMERLEVINVRGATSPAFGASTTAGSPLTGKGVELELEQIEAVHKMYPASGPFLKLLATMLHTRKRLPSSERMTGTVPLNTIPEALGQPYRLPGVRPFTSFVVDNMLANVSKREYVVPADRWKINDLCLCYVERALASFDVECLVNSPEDEYESGKAESIVVSLLTHPGYDIASRLLSSTPLQSSILTYLLDGAEGVERGFADEEVYFRNTIVRVLRIVSRLLEIQDIFLDVLIPLLADFPNTTNYVGHVPHRSYFTKFDQTLSFDAKYAPAIARYVEFGNHPELVLLGVKLMTFLSTSQYFANIVQLIERNPASERILNAFQALLSCEVPDDISQVEVDAELETGAGAEDIGGDDNAESLTQAIRLAALNLLIQDTPSTRSFPTMGHWLLFGTNKPHVQDPHALGSRKTAIHVLLELVNKGVPRIKDKHSQQEMQEQSELSTPALFLALPALAEKCYKVIYQLSTHPRTSEFVTRYLRSREDFFRRQISSVPAVAPEAHNTLPIQVVYSDGSGVITTVDGLSSFLRLQSYIFDLVALELHMLTAKHHHKGVEAILNILFNSDVDYAEENDFASFREVGQSNMRIVDFFQSLIFEWQDSLQVRPVTLQYLAQLNLQASIRKDANGCDVVDRPTLFHMIDVAKRNLVARGTIATTAQVDTLQAETTYILESCAVENHRREVAFSVAKGFESWRRLLDLALTKCFDRLPHDRRENMLVDLLHGIPAAIRSPHVEEPTAVLLSEATLSLITKLREDRRYQLVLQSGDGAGYLPAERLHSILRNVVEGIMDSNHSELIRGNLYGSLINFIQLILASNNTSQPSSKGERGEALTMDMLASFSNALVIAGAGSSTSSSASSAAVETGILSALKPVLERLVVTVARDAIDGTEVWKTVAFMLLDAVVQLSSREKPPAVLNALDRHGILANFVRGIKDSDSLLQSVLKPDPDDLNPLYVYEAKMSLFIRMSQTRQGAERLLEAQLIPVLAQCDYLDTMPETDQAFMDNDSFLPSAVQRYHQLFTPAIQIINGIIAILGTNHATAANQALEFLSMHSSTIAILLKTEADYVSLAILEEIHLVVALCANVLPIVPANELLAINSGFGVINAAILALSTRCLGRGKAFERVMPGTEAEVQANNLYAFGHGSCSKFEVMVQRKERALHKSIISYLGSAGDFTEPEINLVLSPVTVMQKRDDQSTRFSNTVPTIGDALAALDDLSSDLADVLQQISTIGAELASKHHISSNEVQEILREFDSAFLKNLEPEQTRAVVYREMKRIQTSLRGDARVIVDSMEMLMLLLWRHLEYYAKPGHINMPPAKASVVANAMRLLQTADPVAFRNDAASKIAPLLQKLDGVQLTPIANTKDWQESQGYLEIMCRRLKDVAGLADTVDASGEAEGQNAFSFNF